MAAEEARQNQIRSAAAAARVANLLRPLDQYGKEQIDALSVQSVFDKFKLGGGTLAVRFPARPFKKYVRDNANRSTHIVHGTTPAGVAQQAASNAERGYMRQRLINDGQGAAVAAVEAEWARMAAASNRGGFFGGFVSDLRGMANIGLNLASQSVQLAKRANVVSQSVILPHGLQSQAARNTTMGALHSNKTAKAVAIVAATIYTGGAAAAAMGGGAMATAGGAMISQAAVGKLQGNSFSLKNTALAGVTAGIGQYAQGLEVVSNPGLNAAITASASNAVTNKLNGRSFSLQNSLLAGASSGLPVAGGNYAMAGNVLEAAKNVKAAQKAYAGYQAAKKEGADMAAANAELAALNAELLAAQKANNVVRVQEVSQAIVTHPAVVASQPAKTTTHDKTKLAAFGLVALKLLTLV